MATPPDLNDVLETLVRLTEIHPDDEDLARARQWVVDLVDAESPWSTSRGGEDFPSFLRRDLAQLLQEQGIKSGRICEVGGGRNSFASDLPDYDFTFLSLYPDERFNSVLVADAAQSDHLPAEQFDAIFSVAVFEHINKPWLAAENLARLLKPGGLMYHAAPFSYFYHGSPADYWRFTPDALKVLFSELRPVKAEFFSGNRRRDNRGSRLNPVDRDGGPQFSVDAFGGWRENWFTIYAGIKDAAYLDELMETAKKQTVVNLIKMLTQAGCTEEEAAERVHVRLWSVRVTRDQELYPCEPVDSNFDIPVPDMLALWRRRGKPGSPRPSRNRTTMARRVGLIV